MLQSMGSQRVRHNLMTERQQQGSVELVFLFFKIGFLITLSSGSESFVNHMKTKEKNCFSAEIYKKSRDITLLTKVCVVKAMVFPIIMY